MNDEKVVENGLFFDGTTSIYEAQLENNKRQFGIEMDERAGFITEEQPPTFEINSRYNPNTRTILAFFGNAFEKLRKYRERLKLLYPIFLSYSRVRTALKKVIESSRVEYLL